MADSCRVRCESRRRYCSRSSAPYRVCCGHDRRVSEVFHRVQSSGRSARLRLRLKRINHVHSKSETWVSLSVSDHAHGGCDASCYGRFHRSRLMGRQQGPRSLAVASSDHLVRNPARTFYAEPRFKALGSHRSFPALPRNASVVIERRRTPLHIRICGDKCPTCERAGPRGALGSFSNCLDHIDRGMSDRRT